MSMTGHKWMPRYPSQQHRIVVYTYKYCHKLAALPIKCHWKYVYPLNFIAWNKRLTINYHASYSSSCASKMCVCFVRRAQYVFFSVCEGDRENEQSERTLFHIDIEFWLCLAFLCIFTIWPRAAVCIITFSVASHTKWG